MPTIGDASLQPLESLAASGKRYVTGEADANSQTFLPLTAVGSQDQHNAGGAATLPMLVQSAFVVGLGGFAQGDATLPRMSGNGWTGGQASATLPMLGGTGAGTVPGQALGAATLPMLTGDGSGTVPNTGLYANAGGATLPMLTTAAWFAGRGQASIPSLAAAGAVSSVGTGTSAVVLPALRGSGTSVVASYPAAGAAILPMLRAGPYASARSSLPMLVGAGFNAGAVAGSGLGVGAFEGWALNIRTGFVGRITNWPFRQIVKWGDKLLGVGADGLYLLGGTKDFGQVMQWEWRTGLDDMNLPGIKRIPYLYLDAVIDGEIEVTTIDDQGHMRAYHYEADRGRINMPHRRELGKGVRTRNIAFGARNGTNGAYMEMYSLEPEATVTQRSI